MTGRPSEEWRRELRRTWPVLRPGAGDQLAVYPIEIDHEAGDVLLAADGRGDHHLLVPILPGDEVIDDLLSAHVRMTKRDLVVDGKQARYLDVVCHRPDLNSLFDDVLAAMLQALEASRDTASSICGRVLDKWRELLRKRGSPLREEAVRGLIGELVVLEQVLIRDEGVAVHSTWTGPDRTPHDIHLGGHDLEVKSLGANAATVEIHGLDQLDPVDRRLHLILVHLGRHAEGASLPELVDRVRSHCRDITGFNEQLSKAGYSESDVDAYAVTRYRVEQILAMEVDQMFPCLTRQSLARPLPEVVTDLRYKLDLVALLPDALTGAALTPLFERSFLG